ncbi:hypothetical protein [Bacillus phage Anath]|uniref:Uncharacterized protein n=1 Tax=Bacillus phage Anath TaxID=2108114 RepID=A0A2P1JUP3_9CAUD|nr:hypothetical protein [Bacillus phage Anath]
MNTTQQLTKRFNLLFVVHIQTYECGRKLFTAEEGGKPSLVTVDSEGWVLIKNNDSAWWDVLGNLEGRMR